MRGGVREWELVAEDREIEVAPGVKYAAWTYNGRVPGPTLRAREGERLRIRFVNGSRHPHTIHFHGIHRDVMDGVPGRRRRQHRARRARPSTSSTPRRSACTSTTATRRPLAEHIAKGLYGAFVIDPKAGRRRGRRARDGHERVRHELRPLQRGLRRQLGRVRLHGRADPGEARRAGADLPRQRARVRPRSTRSTSTPTSSTTTRPARGSSRATSPTPSSRARASAASSSCASRTPGSTCSTPTCREFAELGWMGFFEVTGDADERPRDLDVEVVA